MHADPLGDFLLTNDDILGRVDEYSLYCHYLEYEPIPQAGKYKSPIRPDDDDPSFGIFYSKKSLNREFLWKDQAIGVTGDIFKLVQLMFRYPTVDHARLKIIKDFHLGESNVDDGQKIVFHEVPESFVSDIRVKSRPFKPEEIRWWQDININETLLTRYNVTALQLYWLAKEQTVPYTAKPYTFAYRIWDKYKIYQPYADKKFKFRNNFTDDYIEGVLQLEYKQSLLVITKSLKDVMFLSSIGYEAIAPHSENTPLPNAVLRALESIYPNIVLLFDNDGKARTDFYEYPALFIPQSVGYKDPTDVARYLSIHDAKTIVDELLNPYK